MFPPPTVPSKPRAALRRARPGSREAGIRRIRPDPRKNTGFSGRHYLTYFERLNGLYLLVDPVHVYASGIQKFTLPITARESGVRNLIPWGFRQAVFWQQ